MGIILDFLNSLIPSHIETGNTRLFPTPTNPNPGGYQPKLSMVTPPPDCGSNVKNNNRHHTYIEFAPCSMEIKFITNKPEDIKDTEHNSIFCVPEKISIDEWTKFIKAIIDRYENVKIVRPYIDKAVDIILGRDTEEGDTEENNTDDISEVTKFKNELIDRLNNSIDRYRGGNLAGRDYPDIETFCVDDVYEMIDSVFNKEPIDDGSVDDIDLPEASRKCKERIGFSFYEDYMKIKDSIKDISKDMRDTTKEEQETIDDGSVDDINIDLSEDIRNARGILIDQFAKDQDKEILDWCESAGMRDATKEERETIDKHIKEISEPTGYNFWDALKESKEKKRKEAIKYMHPGIPDIPNEETSNNNGYIIIYKENSMKANGIVKLTNQDVVRSILSIYNGEDVFVVPSCLEPSITDDNEFEFHYIGNYSDTAKTEWENFNKELEFRKTNINMKNGNFEIINTDELILTELREIKEEIKKINDSRHENSEEDLIKICEKLMSDDINKNIEEAISKAEYNPLMTTISTEQMEKQLNELSPRIKSVFEEAGRSINEFGKRYNNPEILMDNLIKKQHPDIANMILNNKPIQSEIIPDVFDIGVK